MVYYPILALMLAGIRDILIISTPYDLPGFKRLLGDGSDYGVHFKYAWQLSSDGFVQAFIIGEKFIGDDSACLVLGDNIFHGSGFTPLLQNAVRDADENGKAIVFGYWVSDSERYGVAEFDKRGSCLFVEEKPKEPKSKLCRSWPLLLLRSLKTPEFEGGLFGRDSLSQWMDFGEENERTGKAHAKESVWSVPLEGD